MRPRGESGSWPSSAYVGQLGRQRPQCTHWRSNPYSSSARTPGRPAPAGGGLGGIEEVVAVVMRAWPPPSDPAHEAARVEDALWVEPRLQPTHEVHGRAGRVPHRTHLAYAERGPLDDEVSPAGPGGGAPLGKDSRGDG